MEKSRPAVASTPPKRLALSNLGLVFLVFLAGEIGQYHRAVEAVGKLKKLKNRGMKNHSKQSENALQVNCGPRFFAEIFSSEFSHSLYRVVVLTPSSLQFISLLIEEPSQSHPVSLVQP